MRFFSKKTIENLIKGISNSKKTKFRVFGVSGTIVIASIFSISTLFVSLSYVKADDVKSFAPERQSMMIFPSDISSRTWKNISTLNNQEVDEQALFQDFNTSNSAYVEFVNDNSPSEQNSANEVDVSPVPEFISDDSEISSEEVINDIDTDVPFVQDSNSESITEAIGVPEETQAVEGVQVEDVPATQESPAQNDAPTSDAPISLRSFNDAFFAELPYVYGFARANGEYLFAQAETSTPISSDFIGEENSTDESVLEENVETSSSDVQDTVEYLSTEQDTLGAESDATEPASSLDDGEVIDRVNDSSDTQANVPVSNELVLRDFGIPNLISGQFIDNLQLRLSLTGQYGDETSTEFPSLEIKYSFGEFSRNAGSIFIEEEISNALNGGFFLIPLPSITDPALLSDLEITISVRGDTEQIKSLYIDSAWLETGTVLFDKELLEERFSSEEMLKHLDGLENMELLSDRLDFLREELPQFNLKYTSQRNFIIRAIRGLFGKDLATVESVSFISSGGDEMEILPEVTITPEGLVSVVFLEDDKELLLPDTYTVELTLNEGGYVSTDSFEFQWGLLSINSNKTTYQSNDVVNISMGALSPNGNTLCDANLNLYVSDPQGFISSPLVVSSGQCQGNNVIDVPDYSSQFLAGIPGEYVMYLERVDELGNVISHTTETFFVTVDQPIVIERSGPTRIYPPAPYAMDLTVHARTRAFEGVLIERVPSSFTVFNTDAEIRVKEDYTELVWKMSIENGSSKTVSYEFDAPDISPYLYELGPAQLVSNEAWPVSIAVTNEPAPTTAPSEPNLNSDANIETPSAPPVEEITQPEAEVVTPSADSIPEEASVAPEVVPVDTSVIEDISVPEAVIPEVPVSDESSAVEEVSDVQTSSEAIQNEELSYVSVFKKVVGKLLFAQAETIEPTTPTEVVEAEATNIMTEVLGTEPVVESVPTSTPQLSNIVFIEHRQWQIASDATGNMLLYWDGTNIPSGWTCVSCAPTDVFYQRFIVGSSTAGTNGGAATHTHTASGAASTTASSTSINSGAGGGSTNVPTVAHTHNTYTPTISTDNNLPAYRELVVIQYNSAGSPPTIPTGAIAVFDAAVPSGWTRYSAQDGRYIRGASTSTVGTASSSNTHTHDISGNLGGSTGSVLGTPGDNLVNTATDGHTHTVSTTTVAVNHEPLYREVILGKLNATSSPTDAMIAMWTDTQPLGWGLLSGPSDPFQNRFAKASTTYGAVGGSPTTTHSNVNNIISGGPSGTQTRDLVTIDATVTTNAHTHRVSVTNFTTATTTPPYRTAIFAKRAVGGAEPSAPTVHTLFDNERTGTSTPRFEFTGDDPDGSDTLVYQFQWDDDIDVGTAPVGDRTSDNESGCSPNCFSNTASSTDTHPYTDNERMRFTIQTPLTTGVTYYWRVRVKETIGNIWSSWSTIQSVTYDSGTSPSTWYQTEGSQFEDGSRSNVSTTTGDVRLATTTTSVPTVVSGWTTATATAAATLTLTKPSNVEVGDLLIILVGNDDNTATAQWDNATLKPSGFTLINEAGDAASAAAHTAAFYRVADGTETGTTSISAQSADHYWGYYIRVTGASTTNPINATGADYLGAGAATHAVTSVTTTVANTLAFYVLSGDGGDMFPFSAAGTGWTESAETRTIATADPGASGTWGTRSMTTAGATGAVTITPTVTDSAAAFQFAINPSQARGTIVSPEIDFDSVSGQNDWGQINWNTSEPTGTDTKLRVYYTNISACDTLVPESALSGNAAGFDASASGVFIYTLSTTTYNRICLKSTLLRGTGTTTPTLTSWEVAWTIPNQQVNTPILGATPAFDNYKSTTTQPIFGGFSATDYDNDTVEYELIVDDTNDFSSPVFRKQSSNYATDAGWTSAIFTSGTTTRYTVQSGDALTSGTTYWWAVRARDPLGTNTWSATSTARSMTISTTATTPEWFQTTSEQFENDTLTDTSTTTGGVELSDLILNVNPITTQSAWAQQYANAAYPTGTVNASYSISAGTNRVLLVAIASTRSTVGTQTVGVYYGGKPLTKATGDDTNATNRNHTYIYYLSDADISAATTTVLNVQITGGTSYYNFVYASVFTNVDQTSIYTDARNYFSGATADATVGPFASGLTIGEGDQAVEIINLARSVSGNAVRTVTGWSNTSWPAPSTVATTFDDNTWNVGLHINNRNATSSGTEASAHTASAAGTVDSMSGISLKVYTNGSIGDVMSTEIDHDFVPNQSTWGEVTWSVTEPTGSDTLMRLYYSSTTACDTIIPDGALSGNSAGFDRSLSPLNISSLSTTTYNRICLNVELRQGSALSSPMLNDWTVRWTRTPQFSQSEYQWFVNEDSLTPTDIWPVGSFDLAENEAIDVDSSVISNESLRLRMSLTGTSTSAAIGTVSFKLQFAEGGESCSADLVWSDVGDTASTTAIWRGFNNPSIADATILPSTLLINSDVYQTYEERNNSYPNLTAINIGEVAEWDWTLYNNLGTPGALYCFRMVTADGLSLKTYTNYPTLITNDSPDAPILHTPFDNEKLASTTPWFEFVGNDIEGNEIDYQIQIDNDYAFSSTVIDTDSETNLDDFLNIGTPADKSPFNNASRMRYTIPSALTNGVTYWWRVRAKDVNGSNSYGNWSTAESFTVDTSVIIDTWFQTTEAQFDTNTLEGTDATGANLVSFASGSTTGTTTSSSIDFSDATIGNAWGEFSFTETGAASNILYHLEYLDEGVWTIIPNTALAGNETGYDTSPVDLIDLDSSIYSVIRIRADFRSGSPTLLDWTIRWGERVSVPTHIDPFDNEKFSTTSPTFTFYSTDPQSDELEYEISWSTDYTFATGSTTKNSSSSPTGFVNLTTGADTSSPYISGDTIAYTVQPPNALTSSSTYWWRVRAKDPLDSNSYSFWSDPWSFTTATSGQTISVSTWFQTLGLQFDKGTLSGVTSATGSVGIGGGITLESGWTSNTAIPSNSLTLTKPSGVNAGDLLLIIVGNDNITSTSQWDNFTLKPSGFTFINTAGNLTPDAHVAAFYRVATGAESTTINVPAQSSANFWGYYIRVTGVDTSNPIDVTGADYAVNNLLSHPITGITTTVNNALAFYLLSADGGDAYPFSVSGTGWVERAEIQAGTLGTNAAGTWGTRAMTTAGATGAATVAMTVSDGASGFQFALKPATVTSGTLVSPTIDFDNGSGPAWGELSWVNSEPGVSEVLYQLQFKNGVGVWELIPDSVLSGNAAAFTNSPINLETLNTSTYNELRVLATLICDGSTCPTINDWTLEWSRGFSVSGTAFEYNGVSSTTAGTVAIAVNGVLQIGKTGTINSNGYWSIDDVTFFNGDVITVFVSSANDIDEAVAVTKYDGTPDITGMRLQKRRLTIGSNDFATITNTHIGEYDFTDDEDLFNNVDGGNDLTMCADVSCGDAGIVVLSRNTYNPGTGTDITTHDFRNDGTFIAGSNTIRVNGSWDNNATTTMTGSSVIFTATSTTEALDETGAGVGGFNSVTFGEGSGTATWSLGSTLTVLGNLSVAFGTLSRNNTPISVSGNLTIGAGGFWTGIGTTTFDGINPGTWTDSNATKQNVGHVVVDGTSKTLVLGSNVLMQTMTIGANDTFDASITGYTASVYGNWTNNNIFTARTGTVDFVSTTTNRTITAGSNAFYNLTFSGVGGSWSFTGADLSVTNNFTIATGTVTMPTGTTTITGSFTNSGGTFAHNNATVLLNTTGAQTITTSGTAFTNAFYNLRFTGSGSWSFTEANATTSNNLLITQGTVTFPSGIFSVGGSFAQTGGSFTHNSGTLRFTSANPETIDINGSSFNSLSFTGSGSRSFVDASVTALGNVSVTGGTLVLPSGTLTLGGSFTNTATTTHNSGTVLFNSSDVGETISLGNSPLYNMTFNSLTGGWTITTSATTTNNFTLSTTSTFTLASGQTLAVGGTFTNDTRNASTTWTGSTLSLEAGNYTINRKTHQGDTYETLRLKANTDIKMWNSTATTYAVDGTGSLYSQDHSGTDGDLYIFGEYERTSGSEYWSYATDFDGVALGGSGRQVDVRFANGSSASVRGALFQILGTSTASTTIANQGSGTYTVTASSTSTQFNYYDFSNLGATGVVLVGGGTVVSLDDGVLKPGINAGTGFTISSTTIDANPAFQINRVDFSTTSAISATNVTQTDGSPSSYWWFRQTSGNIDGEAFDNDTGDPGSIRWDDSSLVITVSGAVYSDDGVTPMGNPVCDNATANIRIVVEGGSAYTGSCASLDGTFSIPGVVVIGDPVVTVYLNTNGGARGTVVTRTPTSDIADLDIYQNRVITRHEDTEPMTILKMAAYDYTDDTDISFIAATGTLTLLANTELHIASSTTFAPSGDITINANASSTAFDGSLHIDNSAIFTGSGTSTYTIGGNFTMDDGATFTSASTTVLMNATTTGKTITTGTTQEITFNNLEFNGAAGGWNVNGDIRAIQDIDVTTGTVTGTADITVVNGSLSGNGLLSMGSGTTTIHKTNTLGGTTAWTFANLVLGNGSVVGTTTPGSTATTTVLGKLTISTAHYLDAGNSLWNLSGAGNVFVENGTFLEDTSTIRYSGTTATNILSTGYYNLDLKAFGGSPTYTATGLGIVITNNLVVGGATTTTVNFDTSDPALDINGNITIDSTGTFISSASAAFTVAGNWDNNGTYTGSGGTVVFDGSGASSIAAGNSSFSTAVINGTGAFTVSEHATATSAFTLTNAGSFTLASGQILAVGGTFTNGLGGAATTWTGSTLYLYGGNYQINTGAISDSYEVLSVGNGTQIRMWNSTAATYSISSTGSLYSQDHSGVNGDLYIYGAYTKNSGTDYWDYSIDFDGTDISGSPRNVDVYIIGGGSVLYTGGGLSVVGIGSASTTIQNQGSGTYSFRIGGTASTTWSYYDMQDMDSVGLTFSGTPSVTTLSRGEITVSQSGGSAMTVGGTVITQNPAKTFTNNNFATSTGISPAYNVTATGTTASSWRFTNHAGAIAGEDFDVDPDGNPGYLVWDNSASNITVSGTVYSDEGSTPMSASVCDGSTQSIHLRVGGLTSYTGSCNGSGVYSIPGVLYSPSDSLVVYIDGETEKAATVTEDPVSNITGLDLYENRVIVRHESSDPLSIADMAVWSASDDADIPFTAVDGSPDTLTLPANRKLIIWNGKEFEPNGNVTVSGNGAGSAYDGTLELYTNAIFDATGSETHTIGGSLISGSGATIDDETSTFIFTTTGASRTIDTNNNSFYNATFNGSGSWTVTNTTLDIGNDFTITQGAVTLPSATTTITGSLSVTGGSFDANSGTMIFNSGSSETIRPRNSGFGTLLLNGAGSFSLQGGYATTTGDVRIIDGTFTSATGTLTVGGNFINSDTFTHGSGVLRFTSAGSVVVTASTSDLYSTSFSGGGSYSFSDTNVAILGDLSIVSGSVSLATGTMSIGGSFLNTGGSFNNASGTILFNSSNAGEIINPGNSPFHTVTFASAGGGWTVTNNATTTGNFSLTSATNFTLSSSTSLFVGGVFTNLVGGAATTWTGSTLTINSGSSYTINSKTAGGDTYNTLRIGSSTSLRAWDSTGVVTITDTESSLYSQDHAGVSGSLYIFGDYERTAGTDYWSYATDFDGTALAGSSRQVFVYMANAATTTLSGGTLNIVGASGFDTTVSNQGSGTYAMNIQGGTFNGLYYSLSNMNDAGLRLTGLTAISSLTEGNFTLAVNGGSLITVSSTTLNYNAGLFASGVSFGTTTAITGTNVSLIGTTPSAWTFTAHTGNLDGEAYDNDGGDDCGSIRWDDSGCILIEQSAYRFRNDDGGEGVPNSEWFDLDWSKRKRVIVTNFDPITYTDAVIKLTIPYDADMQADFDDLRFTESDGLTQTEYFVESYTASTQAVVWVKVPTLATSTTAMVYMYYGEGTVSDGSATSTFNFMDNFEDGNISEYTGDTGDFSVVGSSAYERTYRLEAFDQNNSKTDQNMRNMSVMVEQGQTLRWLQYINTSTGSADESCTHFGVQTGATSYAVCLELFGVDRLSISKNATHRDTSGTVLASTTVTYSTGWYEVEVDWDTDDSMYVRLSKNGAVVATTTATDSTYTSGGVGFTLWGYHGGWDIYSARPLIATAPTTTIGAEQVPGGASWISALNTTASGVNIGDKVRARFLVENGGTPVTAQNYEIEFAAKGAAPSCESVDYNTFVEVPNVAACGTSEICMESSSHITNLESTTDILGGEGTFAAGQVVEDPSNNTGNIDVDSSEFTELEYVIMPTVNVADSDYCFRVTNEGSELDAYTKVAELSLVFVPNITALSLNGGLDITLTGGATTTVTATGTVSDLNGYSDLSGATTTIFRSGVGESCSLDNNNCYISGNSRCSFINCTGNSCDVICTADMYYHADPTDIGTFAAETWRALLAVSDLGGSVATATAPSIDLLTLRAIAVDSAINYGALAVNADTGSYNATTTVQNIGNDALDLSIEGTDLTDGGSSVIPVNEQKFATSTFTYSACVFCSALSTSPASYEMDLSKPASTTPAIVDELYWGIAVPFGVAGSAHQGTNIFYAIGD